MGWTAGGLILAALALGACPASGQVERTVPPPPAGVENTGSDAATILQRYVDAWRGADEMALSDTLVVGFRFTGDGGGAYHAIFAPDGSALLRPGVPDGVIQLHGDMEILRRLDRGDLSAMTAMGRAHLSDRTPLDFTLPEGMSFSEVQTLLPWIFHFWNREWPEVARFGEGTTRRVHGGESAILYYDTGLRTAFYRVDPGQHINEAADQQTNPFSSLFVVIRGGFRGRFDGRVRPLREGEAVLVPTGMRHEFWAEEGEYGEMLMIAFGEGA